MKIQMKIIIILLLHLLSYGKNITGNRTKHLTEDALLAVRNAKQWDSNYNKGEYVSSDIYLCTINNRIHLYTQTGSNEIIER